MVSRSQQQDIDQAQSRQAARNAADAAASVRQAAQKAASKKATTENKAAVDTAKRVAAADAAQEQLASGASPLQVGSILDASSLLDSVLAPIPPDQRNAFVVALNKKYGTSFDPSNKDDIGRLSTFIKKVGPSVVNEVYGAMVLQPDVGPFSDVSGKMLDVADQGQLLDEARQRRASQGARVSQPVNDEVDTAVKLNPRSTPYIKDLANAAQKYAVPWQLLYGVVNQQSGFDPDFVDPGQNKRGIAGLSSDDVVGDDPKRSIDRLAQHLAANYGRYKNWSYAALAIDSSAAADAVSGSRGLQHAAGRAVADGQYLSSLFATVGALPGTDKLVAESKAALPNIQGRISTPDLADIRQRVADEFQAMYLRAASPTEIERLSGVVTNVFTQANQRDIESQLSNPNATPEGAPNADNAVLQSVKDSPEYQRLYRNKPASQTEAQYAKTFLDAGHQLLGADANVDQGARLGLSTGSASTEAGYLSGTSQAQESATFRQLMFQKASLFNQLV